MTDTRSPLRHVPRLFLSYCHEDRTRVMRLREALGDRAVATWLDRAELRLGDDLAGIEAALKGCDGMVQVLSAAGLESDWLCRERDWALEALEARADTDRPFRLLPLRVDLGLEATDRYYNRELLSLELTEPVGEVADRILEAVGLVAPRPLDPGSSVEAQVPFAAQTNALVIRLFSPWRTVTGERGSATWPVHARASVVHQPGNGAAGGSSQIFSFTSPIGESELLELRWYLEKYLEWPYGSFRDRAAAIEARLPAWGQSLYAAILQPAFQQVLDWRQHQPGERRIVIELEAYDGASANARLVGEGADAHLVGADTDARLAGEAANARPAGAALLALPWELLHDGRGYLFEGGNAARILRRISGGATLRPLERQRLLRVLLVLSRPEAPGVPFLDPRASVAALTEALDPLGDRVVLEMLPDGTFDALQTALEAADRAGAPFNVVHFDGHGVYDHAQGLGVLCFEDASDVERGLLQRKAELIGADRLGGLLQDRRVPLCVLAACQSGQAGEAVESSVAVGLLKAGIGSVVAMSHSLLLETARRFTSAFYSSLAEGARIGDAMNRATHDLRNRRNRAPAYSDETLELHDWMVPVLFQEPGGDVALVPAGARANPEALARLRNTRLGRLPEEPVHGFVGRARALMAVHRLLRPGEALVLTAPGGQGKTALALACARWLSETRQVARVAFVRVEQLSQPQAFVDAIGAQLVPGFSAVVEGGTGTADQKREKALIPIRTALQRVLTLVLIDNLETLLPAPGEALHDEAQAVLELLEDLRRVGRTRILLTSRQALPPGLKHVALEVPRLNEIEGAQLVRGVIQQGTRARLGSDQKQRIEALVEQVGGHARALVLLAPVVAEGGAALTGARLREEIERLERLNPGERELSLLASVRLSLDRLPATARKRVRALAVFHAVVHHKSLADVLQIAHEQGLELCRMLEALGLADAEGPFLLLDPALGQALLPELEQTERRSYADRWFKSTVGLLGFLYQQHHFQNAMIASEGTRVALMELLAVLEEGERRVEVGSWSVEEAVGVAVKLESLVGTLGLPGFLARVVATRQRLQARIAVGWSHAAFIAASAEIERLLEAGQAGRALTRVEDLLVRSEAADHTNVVEAYDVATMYKLKGRILSAMGHAQSSLIPLEEARRRFQGLADRGEEQAARMVSRVLSDQADVLLGLGRLGEAAGLYQASIELEKARGDLRAVANGNRQLGFIQLLRRHFDDALRAYHKARTDFELLAEPGAVAAIWHQIGMVDLQREQWEAAEEAFRQALRLWTSLDDQAGLADTLGMLGLAYQGRTRHAEALRFFQQAEAYYRPTLQSAKEAAMMNNRAISFQAMGRLDEARSAILSSVAVKESLGHSAEPWKSWATLQDIELEAGDHAAARLARQRSMAAYRAAREDGWERLDPLSSNVDRLAKLTVSRGPAAARAQVPPAERFAAQLHPFLGALLAILGGDVDGAWREDLAIDPIHAVELDRLAEAVRAGSGEAS